MTTSNRPVRKRIAADTVTVRGWLDDPTATLTAEWVNPPGQTNACVALVERHGRFWLRGLPLSAGTNEFILKAVDARTNTLVTNLTLVRGALTVTVDPPGGDLWGGPVPVSGTNWSGAVQIGGGGVGVVTVTVYPPGQEPPAPVPPGAPHAEEPPANPENDAAEVANAPEAQWEEPSRLYVERYEAGLTYCEASWAQSVGDLGAGPVVGEGSWSATGTEGFAWQDGVGGWGGWEWAEQFQYPFPPTNFPGWAWGTWTWPATWWPALADAGEEVWEGDWTGGPHTNTLPPPKVLMEQRDTRVRGRWDWNLGQGPNGEPLSGWETWDYRRTAVAVVKLFTGGWSVARLRTLWELSGSAAEILDPHAVPPYDWPTPRRTIAPERLEWGDLGCLDYAGLRHEILPCGATVNATVTAPGVNHAVPHSAGQPKGLILVAPSGYPTNAPSDPNRACYSPDDPGVLELVLRAVLTNNGSAWALTNRVRFEADEIPGSTQGWSPDNPGGRPVANGSELSATLYYTNLPPSNSAFGLKFARVKLDGVVQDTKCFWVFYPADAYNYPGCRPWNSSDAELQTPEGDKTRPPNYFHYYMQTAAAVHSPCCDSPTFHWGGSKTWFGLLPDPPLSPPFPYQIESARHRQGQEIHLPGEAAGPSPSYANGGERLGYIDLFAWAVRHKKAHHDAWHAWGTTGTPPPPYNTTTDDVDTDFLLDGLEPKMPASEGGPYNPATKFTFGSGEFEDCERHGCVTAVHWTSEQQTNSFGWDWAAPGKNWPGYSQ